MSNRKKIEALLAYAKRNRNREVIALAETALGIRDGDQLAALVRCIAEFI